MTDKGFRFSALIDQHPKVYGRFRYVSQARRARFARKSPLLGCVSYCFFDCLQWISPPTWRFHTRSFTVFVQSRKCGEHLFSWKERREYVNDRARCVEVWIVLTIILSIGTLYLRTRAADNQVIRWVGGLLAAWRIVDIFQANVNMHVFDYVRMPKDNAVNSIARSMLLTLVSYVEMIVHFAAIYSALGFVKCECGRRIVESHSVWDYLYFSGITQTTVGFGDISPGVEFARFVAMFQGTLSTFLVVVAIARFASAMKAPTELT